MFRKLLVLSLTIQLACAGTQGRPTTTPPVAIADVSLPNADVALLGLPRDAGQVTGEDATDDASTVALVPGGGPNGEMIVPIRADARAPFTGVLFNGPAVGRVAVEFRTQAQRCLIDRQHDMDLAAARYTADVATLQLALTTQRRTDQVLINSRDVDIARLNRLLTEQQRASNGPHVGEGLIWAGGGLLLGALVVGGIVVFANIRP